MDKSTDRHNSKKFGKGERTVPHHTEKAPKYYPAVDVAVAKKVRTQYTNPMSRRGLDEEAEAMETQEVFAIWTNFNLDPPVAHDSQEDNC